MITLLIFFVVLAALVFVHELGHFLAAKAGGIRVDEFGLGFPPRLFGRKKGETIYSVNAIPFGGFVRIFGEDGGEGLAAFDPRSFVRKNRAIQAFVVVAGVLGNFLFAWALFSAGYMIGLPTPADDAQNGQAVSTIITEVISGSPAEAAGLKHGDRIIFVAGETMAEKAYPSPDEIHSVVSTEKKGSIALGVRSPGEETTRTVLVEPKEGITENGRALGIGMTAIVDTKLGFIAALKEGARLTAATTINTVAGFIELIRNFITRTPQETTITGPVGLVSVVGETRTLGLAYLLTLIAALSVNLGVVNLVPFPALDGGRLLVIGIEAVLRREIHPKVVGYVNQMGFLVLIFLMVLVTIKDIRAL